MAARGERGPGSDLAPRVLVAIPAIIFALIIVDQGGEIWTVGIFALGVVAMGELYTLMGRVRPPALAGFLTLAAMLAAALYGEPRHVIMVLAASFPVTFFFAVLRPRREHVSWAIAVTYFGVLWIGLAMVHAVWLREPLHGDGLVIDVLVATFLGDTFAYFGGRFYGRTPLAPLISPNKTLEGLVVGVLGATLAFWAARLYQLHRHAGAGRRPGQPGARGRGSRRVVELGAPAGAGARLRGGSGGARGPGCGRPRERALR